MKVAAIIPAAGVGKRLHSKIPKAFVIIRGKPLLVHTLENLRRAYGFHEFIIVVAKREIKSTARLLGRSRLNNFKVVAGGATRAESVLRGLEAVSDRSEWVLVHDAARPLISRSLVRKLLNEVKCTGAVICGLPAQATVKRVSAGVIQKTENRNEIFLAQTPQVFRKSLLAARYRKLGKKAFAATDEAALFDNTSLRVKMILGEPNNIKITVPEDLRFAEHFL